MRRSPRATAAWIAVAALSLITARTVARDLASIHVQARRSGPLVAVVVVRHRVPLGHVLARGDVGLRRMFRADRPSGSFAAVDDVVGRTVVVTILDGGVVVRDALAVDGLTAVAPGQRVVWVPLEHAAARPPAGAVVDVLATFPGSDDPTVTVARGAIVLDTTGGDHDDAGVPLLVTEAAAARVAYAIANGSITLAVAPPESACCQTRS